MTCDPEPNFLRDDCSSPKSCSIDKECDKSEFCFNFTCVKYCDEQTPCAEGSQC